MGSTYGSYGYGDYSGGYNSGYYGYNQQGGSVLGSNTSMSMNNSQIGSAPELTQQSPTSKIMDGISKTYNDGLQSQKKGGGIGDFFKGIFNGIKNLFKSLLDPKTWLMIAACVALCVLVPGAGAVLMALGIGMAGIQIFKGAQSGDMEQVGEGAFNLGLCFLGGSSSVKAGTGAEAANFSRAGTRVAEAESSLAAAKKAGDVKAIESAQKTVELTRAQMARADASAMSEAQRTAHLKNPNVSSLKTADDFKAAKASTQDSLMAAKAGLDDAQTALTAAEKTKDATKITRAKQDLAVAEAQIKQASANVHDVYLAERLQATKDMGMMGRSWEYVKGTGTRTKDSFSMLFGKPMTSVDGRTISYWSRTPKTPEATAANAEAAATKTGSKWNPLNWGKKDPAAVEAKDPKGTVSSSKSGTKTDTTSTPKSKEFTSKDQADIATVKQYYASRQQTKFQAEEAAAKDRMVQAEKDHGKKSEQYKTASQEATEASAKAQRYAEISKGAQKEQIAARKQMAADEVAIAAEKARLAAEAKPGNTELASEAERLKSIAATLQENAQIAKGTYVKPSPTADTMEPGVWERIKGNIAPGIIGSQTAITPLFGGMLGGGDGGGLFG